MGRHFPLCRLAAAILAFGLLLGTKPALAAPAGNQPGGSKSPASSANEIYSNRKALLEQMSTLTGVPWYYLAAMDQYDRTINFVKKRPASGGLIDLYFSDEEWRGLANPDQSDSTALSISLFKGKGMDGDGDGRADRSNDIDKLYTAARYLMQYIPDKANIRIGLWEYYQSSRAVERIMQFAAMYSHFDTLNLHEHAFPLPLSSDYSYRSTWGAGRGWGGHRIHEGTDLFARHGVPVRSTCYGLIEVMGWNPYGGWRVGIRDLNNVYHYYAHLSGFNKEVKAGDIVKPAQVIGWVGSSGYGKPGTSGKFPPHLHYGLYRDNGLSEWSFDPYPNLKRWEREERQRGRIK